MKNKIFEAFLSLAEEKGATNISLSMLARELKMSKANFYTYFKDKETLLYELIINKKEETISKVEEIPRLDVAPEEKLRLFIEGNIKAYFNNKKYWTVFLEILINKLIKDKEKILQLINFRTRLMKTLSEIFNQIFEKRNKRPEVDIDRLSLYVFGILNSVLIYFETYPEDQDYKEHFIGTFFLYGDKVLKSENINEKAQIIYEEIYYLVSKAIDIKF
ncbi:MAG: TetR/AcrR family transcriptional regulator [Candidatus Muiribacteriota bacterium]